LSAPSVFPFRFGFSGGDPSAESLFSHASRPSKNYFMLLAEFLPPFSEKQLYPKGMVGILRPVVNLSSVFWRRVRAGVQRAEEPGLAGRKDPMKSKKKVIDIHFEIC
jgi:hypothetical protein